ncbi:Ada metal-binding domain-containing protein [Brevibacterium casei]|uniref:DNA-3-methyladenine glycosylase II n=2 Tax=Brevibacterium casei TaxID=33889 RepID=A0A2H1IGK8_9MICO|nr:Ada metal-binding domain-containing protein [Brevibacterium casei]PAK96057.1 AraC family transcriptional regulator [Brevibacterium casei]QPR40362.1 DNA-3-methyladenine glycosylase 2 family protein [Brevibacterium casei]QPR44518.1 DNA-3-methyladenine glycosylase 2 family protein [Brevibacterium casei]SMX74236.1 DNA-3-methyladenine glycosylase II [Brevibacterium casei CIP 102111]
MLTSDQCYQAVTGRDRRFDGMFFTAVATTRIFCRPSCPARTPLRENVDFFPTAAAAVEAGYRACKRCRPDVSPGSPDWDVRADVSARAFRLIRDGLVDRAGVSGLASALGYSSRQLGRVLHAELGAGPLALARSERVRTARTLVESTGMTMSEVAFASGFSSIRQFNDTFKDTYGMAPGRLRTGAAPARADDLAVRLAYRAPIDLDHLFAYLGLREIPGVEDVGAHHYSRSLRLAHGPAVITLTPGDGDFVTCRLRLTDTRDLGAAVARARRILDLDADPAAVHSTLTDAGLGDLVGPIPGIRSPGHGEPVELAIRTVLGQQISVRAAQTHLRRLVEIAGEGLPEELRCGTVDRIFPTPEAITELTDDDWALPRRRIATLRTLARALADGTIDLGPGTDRDEAARALLALPGIGPWSVGYIRMRALGDPDVLLASDLGVRKALDALPVPLTDGQLAAARPWRSYLTHLLWAAHAGSVHR